MSEIVTRKSWKTICVYLDGDTLKAVKSKYPGINISATVRKYLEDLLKEEVKESVKE